MDVYAALRKSCAICNRFGSALHYVNGDLSSAKGAFIRRQDAATHAALVEAKTQAKEVRRRWDEHVAEAHVESEAS